VHGGEKSTCVFHEGCNIREGKSKKRNIAPLQKIGRNTKTCAELVTGMLKKVQGSFVITEGARSLPEGNQ